MFVEREGTGAQMLTWLLNLQYYVNLNSVLKNIICIQRND